ncbi:DUF2850 domain-containing protein [Vibrio mexicanus]|uniref:DUF2850 domain-containing protein n=1 Tax=Vibrio mexicanus TaxID=1004326 RepID=UPI00063C80E1|nr:DUF2850 domain-containing protein [Vibrio mexicanus]
MSKAKKQEKLGSQPKKSVEKILISIVLIGGVVTIILYATVYDRMMSHFFPKKEIYGVWVEQNVASYAVQKIILSSEGVSVDGNLVATDFDYDGWYFSYMAGGVEYRYKMRNESNTEMMLESDEHYNPTFKLLENHKIGVR